MNLKLIEDDLEKSSKYNQFLQHVKNLRGKVGPRQRFAKQLSQECVEVCQRVDFLERQP